jgi:hypothetical protein
MKIGNAFLPQLSMQRLFGKPWFAAERIPADVDHPTDTRYAQSREEPVDSQALITSRI